MICIIHAGCLNALGYGRRSYQGKVRGAHRVAWMEAHGPIPEGMEIHHTCEVRACINVDHLVVLTVAEHRRLHFTLTACPKCGNTEREHDGRKTFCRPCRTARFAADYRKRRSRLDV